MNKLIEFLTGVVLCIAPMFAWAAPHHHDTPDHVCVEVKWDYRYQSEYCSVYEARRSVYPRPVYVSPYPRYVHQYRPGVSVNIQHRNFDIRYDNRPLPPLHRHHHHNRRP